MAEYKETWAIDGKEVPQPVVEAIRRKFINDTAMYHYIMNQLKWDSMNGCYYFTYAKMYHGVEPDGYIHT